MFLSKNETRSGSVSLILLEKLQLIDNIATQLPILLLCSDGRSPILFSKDKSACAANG